MVLHVLVCYLRLLDIPMRALAVLQRPDFPVDRGKDCLEKELRVVKGFFVDGARVFKNLVEFFFFFFLHVGRKKTKRGFRGRIVIRCRFIHVSYYFSSLEEGLYYYYIPFQRE